MNVIISGANGFIGSLLVDKFFKEGHRIFSLVKGESNLESIEDKSEIINFDISHSNPLFNPLKSVHGDIFYHFAWQGVNGNDKSDIKIQLMNISLAQRAIDIAKEIGCAKFLCAGSIAERGLESLDDMIAIPSGMIYATAKQALRIIMDTYCRQIDMNHIWMQFSNVYGPTNKTGNIIGYTLAQILNEKEARFGSAMQPYDLLYIDDLIEAAYRLGINKTSRHFYFVGSGKPRILKEYLEIIGKITQKREFIKIGAREDDGIKYSMDMFSINELVSDIGNYVSGDFEFTMRKTIERYFDYTEE